MNKLFIDLETIKTSDENKIEHLMSTIKPNANCKTDEAKQKSIDKQKAECIEKTVFNGDYGEIITIGFAINNEPIVAFQRDQYITEFDILQAFFDTLREFAVSENISPLHIQFMWIAHNIKFDIRILYKRCVINKIDTHGILIPHSHKHGSKYIYDTMEAWAGWNNYISLNELSWILEIPGKDEIDGSMIWDLWESGSFNLIEQYCQNDVKILCEVYNRLNFN